ncbi:amino acid permease [Flexivirga meconopsidis]|uniref:amino acid permease n=1 Tax=Flexivirga meconopsidis TaxID=2977121 RepID=UPI002240987B|nr:amino acid permease [Flexivirga meconopsidis]
MDLSKPPSADGAEHTPKKLRPRHITMVTLGGIIGSSLFVGSANIVHSVGPAAVLSYLAGGLLVYLAMLMLGEMAAARPAVGSFMEYARVGMGDWAAYLVGWLYWYFWVGVLAYEAVIGGHTLEGWFHALPSWLWSLLLLGVFVCTNLISVRSFGETEFWLASIKIAAIIVFLVVGALFVLGLWPDSNFAVQNLWDHGGFAPKGFGAILTGVALVIFSYFGTEIAVMASAESEDPAKGVKLATVTVIWRVLLFFVGSILIITMAIPWNQLPEATGVENAPFTVLFDKFGIPAASTIMELVIFTAVLSVLNSGLYSASRMFASLARKGLAPKLVAREARNGVPVVAVLASTIGGVAAAIVNFAAPNSGIFDFIMNSAGLVALFVYVFIALTQLRLRQKMTPEEVAALQVKVRFFPWLNIFLIAGVVVVVIIMLTTSAGRTQVWTSLVATGVLVLFWPLVRRRLHLLRAGKAT